MAQSTAPVLEYKGTPYTIELTYDAQGFVLPIYHLGSETFVRLAALMSEIDHRINASKLGRRDDEGLI